MSFHHVALATPDLGRTHSFYTEAMGFELAKVVVGATPEGGWAKHVFYDTGDGGLIAFWELHGEAYPAVDGGMSRAVGLPDWVNHLAFRAVDAEHLEVGRKRWLGLGLDVMELDHGFCRSIYTNDVNGTLVEWCLDTRPLDDDDRREGERLLLDPSPELGPGPGAEFHTADPSLRPAWL
jgi:catechol 2,3-dioxygenase-like lactoylglutathione lyase family enzyme